MRQILLQPPNVSQIETIRNEIRESSDNLKNNLSLLESWVICQNYLPTNYDRKLLVSFLRGCKHNLKLTKAKLQYYFIVKSTQAELYDNRILTAEYDLKPANYVQITPLPELTPKGHRIIIFRMSNPDSAVFNILECIRYGLIQADFRINHEPMYCGDVLIFDGGNFTAGHVAKSLTHYLQQVLDLCHNAYPFRVRQVHFITNNQIVVKLIQVLKRFFKDKLRKRVHIHKDVDSLSDHVPIYLLPSDYGGLQKSVEELNEEWRDLLVNQKEWVKEYESVRINGFVPRNVNRPNLTDGSGLEGTFRQLNVD